MQLLRGFGSLGFRTLNPKPYTLIPEPQNPKTLRFRVSLMILVGFGVAAESHRCVLSGSASAVCSPHGSQDGFGAATFKQSTLTLRLKIAQKPQIVWSFGRRDLTYESLEPSGKRKDASVEGRRV